MLSDEQSSSSQTPNLSQTLNGHISPVKVSTYWRPRVPSSVSGQADKSGESECNPFNGSATPIDLDKIRNIEDSDAHLRQTDLPPDKRTPISSILCQRDSKLTAEKLIKKAGEKEMEEEWPCYLTEDSRNRIKKGGPVLLSFSLAFMKMVRKWHNVWRVCPETVRTREKQLIDMYFNKRNEAKELVKGLPAGHRRRLIFERNQCPASSKAEKYRREAVAIYIAMNGNVKGRKDEDLFCTTPLEKDSQHSQILPKVAESTVTFTSSNNQQWTSVTTLPNQNSLSNKSSVRKQQQEPNPQPEQQPEPDPQPEQQPEPDPQPDSQPDQEPGPDPVCLEVHRKNFDSAIRKEIALWISSINSAESAGGRTESEEIVLKEIELADAQIEKVQKLADAFAVTFVSLQRDRLGKMKANVERAAGLVQIKEKRKSLVAHKQTSDDGSLAAAAYLARNFWFLRKREDKYLREMTQAEGEISEIEKMAHAVALKFISVQRDRLCKMKSSAMLAARLAQIQKNNKSSASKDSSQNVDSSPICQDEIIDVEIIEPKPMYIRPSIRPLVSTSSQSPATDRSSDPLSDQSAVSTTARDRNSDQSASAVNRQSSLDITSQGEGIQSAARQPSAEQTSGQSAPASVLGRGEEVDACAAASMRYLTALCSEYSNALTKRIEELRKPQLKQPQTEDQSSEKSKS